MNSRIFYRLTYEHAYTNADGEKKWCVITKDSPDSLIHSNRIKNAKYKQSIGAARDLKVQVIKEIVLSEAEVQS